MQKKLLLTTRVLLLSALVCLNATAKRERILFGNHGTRSAETQPPASSPDKQEQQDQHEKTPDFLPYLKTFLYAMSPNRNKEIDKSLRFSVDSCRIPKMKLVQLFLQKKQFTHKFRFSEGCDVEGDVTFSREPFLVDLKLKNTGNYNRVRTKVEVLPELQAQTGSIKLHEKYRDGMIYHTDHPKPVEFSADYRIEFYLNGKMRARLKEVTRGGK